MALILENKKRKAAGLQPITALINTLEHDNTSSCNNHAIILLAIFDSARITTEFWYNFVIVHSASCIKNLPKTSYQIDKAYIKDNSYWIFKSEMRLVRFFNLGRNQLHITLLRLSNPLGLYLHLCRLAGQ